MAITNVKLRPLTIIEMSELRGASIALARAAVRSRALTHIYLRGPDDDVVIALESARRDYSAAKAMLQRWITELGDRLANDYKESDDA